MNTVPVRNGNLDMALRKFKQKQARDGVPSECKKREAYDKPGVRRRAAKKEGIKNTRKRNKAYHSNYGGHGHSGREYND